MRDALRNEANEMVKGVLSAMLTEQVNFCIREVVEVCENPFESFSGEGRGGPITSTELLSNSFNPHKFR